MLRTLSIAARIALVREQIELAAAEAGRSSSDVRLMAASKTATREAISHAIEAGVTLFGENRVQEAEAKFGTPTLRTAAEASSSNLLRERVELHMIGPLQRNKAKRAAYLFDCVQSMDRVELATDLDRAAGVSGHALPVLLEVNLTGEASKSGVSPQDLDLLADTLAFCPHLRGAGLMTVARMGADEHELRTTFARLRELLGGLQASHPGNWRELSMGMSDDFVAAIKEGSSIVRVGRAIFGERLQGGG